MAINRENLGRPCDHTRGVAPDGLSRFSLKQQVPQSFQSGLMSGFEGRVVHAPD